MTIIKLIIALIMLPITFINVISAYKTQSKAKAEVIITEIYKNILIAAISLVTTPIVMITKSIILTIKITNAATKAKGTVTEGDRMWSAAQQRKKGVFCTNQFQGRTQDKNNELD